MTIKEMHFDFKMKLNKVDSQQYPNFNIPEIDWILNGAQELFVKMVADPRHSSYLGFEIGQRSIDDIRAIVVNNNCLPVVDNIVTLPDNYWSLVSGNVEMSKGDCAGIMARLHIRQHDDKFESSPFDRSSFEWRTVNGVFFEGGIKLSDDKTFVNNGVCLSYIRKLEFIHDAEDYTGGSYTLLSGVVLTGIKNCELPEQTHREIVDLAVAITSNQLNDPNYQMKLNKLSFNELK